MGYCSLLLPCLVSTVGGLIFGYELAIISGALLQIRVDFGLSCLQQEGLASALLMGALLASVVGGSLIDWQGCRKSILLSNAMTLAGTLPLLLSSYSALVIGRGTVGFAVCISSMSCCIFVSELVRPERRGFLVSLYEVGITVGILAAYAVNYIMADYQNGWKWMFGLPVVPTLVQLASIGCLPPNTKSKNSQAEKAHLNQPEIQDSSPSPSTRTKRYNYLSLFYRKDNMRTRIMIGLSLVLFQQFTGQPNVMVYASTIFYTLGFQSNAAAVLASVGLGLVKVLATLFAMMLADRVGRRPLLIGGCTVMSASLIVIGLLGRHSHFKEMSCVSKEVLSNVNITKPYEAHSAVEFIKGTVAFNGTSPQLTPSPLSPPPSAANWVTLLSLMAVVAAYSVGFGPLTWLLLSEIFPTEVRGRAFAFTNCFNWSAHLLVTFTFLNVIDAIGLPGLFVLYGAIAGAAAVFFCVFLPETKGKSLEDIDRELRLNRFDHTGDWCGFIRRKPAQYRRVHCQDYTLE